MTEVVSTVLEVVGLMLIAVAGLLVFVPLGLALAGASCVLVGYQLGGGDVNVDPPKN